MRRLLIFLLIICRHSCFLYGQDQAAITDYSEKLTLRTFMSRKIIGYQIRQPGQQHKVEYTPNDMTGIGLGANYRFLGININLPLSFLNTGEQRYDRTKRLDLATYVYLRKLTVDLFAQVYKGLYLSDNDFITTRIMNRPYAIRPDLQTLFYGMNGHYIFNHRNFSYRSFFLQNEWQRRSAGSFLAGINLHYIYVGGDSAIIPEALKVQGNALLQYDETGMFSVAVDGGYAHTFVVNEHWFATIALMAGAGGVNTYFTNETPAYRGSSFGLNLNGTVRLAAGYNSENWFAGIYYVNFLNRNYGNRNGTLIWQQTENGLYRLVLARRLSLNR